MEGGGREGVPGTEYKALQAKLGFGVENKINNNNPKTFSWSNSDKLQPDWSISEINQIVTKYKSIKANQSKLKPLEFLSSLIFV